MDDADLVDKNWHRSFEELEMIEYDRSKWDNVEDSIAKFEHQMTKEFVDIREKLMNKLDKSWRFDLVIRIQKLNKEQIDQNQRRRTMILHFPSIKEKIVWKMEQIQTNRFIMSLSFVVSSVLKWYLL